SYRVQPKGQHDVVGALDSVTVVQCGTRRASNLGGSLSGLCLTGSGKDDWPPPRGKLARHRPAKVSDADDCRSHSLLLEESVGKNDLVDLLHRLQASPVPLQLDRQRDPG